MGSSTRVLVDFWNFQLNWNDRASGDQRIDWKRVPSVLMDQARDVFQQIGQPTELDLEETLVHASVKTGPEDKALKHWLQGFLDKQPSFRVKIRERKPRQKGIYCRSCKKEVENCPNCQTPFTRAAEKGVDSAIVTDLLTLAWEGAFEIAILLTSDADLVPAVERVQEKGLKVINATWAGHGHELAHTCWGSFQIDTVMPLLVRTDI